MKAVTADFACRTFLGSAFYSFTQFLDAFRRLGRQGSQSFSSKIKHKI